MNDYCQRCGKRIRYLNDNKQATVEVYPFERKWKLCEPCARGLVDAIREYMKETNDD